MAPAILTELQGRRYRRLFEPFCGSAALTLAAAQAGVANHYQLGDALAPLAALWQRALTDPDGLADAYDAIWSAGHADPAGHFLAVRQRFWHTPTPEALLFLLARSVKNAARFGADGRYNQSCDHRRRGVRPERVRTAARAVAALLKGRATVGNGDFRAQLADAGPGDLVYLDPPYLGTSSGRDRRYVAGLERDAVIAAVADLRARGADVLLSYDGHTGGRSYGPPLPAALGLRHVALDAGRSSQATLLGRDERTVESLYVGLVGDRR